MTGTDSEPAPRPHPPPRRSGVVVPHHASLTQRLAADLISRTIEIVGASLRWQVHYADGALDAARQGRCLFATWHNRLALSLLIYRRYLRPLQPDRRMAAMVSASRDGALLARILEWFDVQPVRGSTSRRGPQALRELVGWAERGLDLAITPDGPRGPCYQVQEGVVALAQLTALPLLPVGYRLHRKIRARSWDRFQIPMPFTRVDLVFGNPLLVPRRIDATERESLRSQLEEELLRISQD
jgi:lysophospholipid acyltransferase (LPLAT)-like uncharacterized protein